MDGYRSEDARSLNPMPRVSTDEVLVAAAKLGNPAAFAELWERHSNRTFRLVYRIMKNRDDAEDAVQDAWMKAYAHLQSFNGSAKFSTWLTRIAINSALMIMRRKRTRPENAMEFLDGDSWKGWEIADQTQNTEKLYAEHCTAERLRGAIASMRPSLRSVIETYHFGESSVNETAAIAGISIAAAKSRLLRARTVLRRTLS